MPQQFKTKHSITYFTNFDSDFDPLLSNPHPMPPKNLISFSRLVPALDSYSDSFTLNN